MTELSVVDILLLLLNFAGFCTALYNIFSSMLHREGANRTLWVLCNFILAAFIGFYLIAIIIKLI